MKKYIFILLLFLSSILPAQVNFTISGKIYDSETLEPLSSANIMLEEIDRGTMTDQDGAFNFSQVPAGKYTLSASYIGYRVKKVYVEVGDQPELFVALSLKPVILHGQTIEVTGTRAVERETPVTFSNITQEEIETKYAVADIPMMLQSQPGLYAYSVTGDNLGYSFLKIRGFDQKRVGVMINDIPLNDPEDHQVYWVDLPDLAESTADIQIQRGVGSSLYGSSTFGGSINIRTEKYSSESYSKLSFGGGSFNTQKAMAEYKSGLINNTYAIYGRFSKIRSDGYRRKSGSDLESFFLGLERYDPRSVTRLNIFSGKEITHPDWWGIPESILKNDRRYKYETYDNTVDDFTQSHYQLINEYKLSADMLLNNTLYYIRGEGYYENLKNEADLTSYGMLPFSTADPDLFGDNAFDYYRNDGTNLVQDSSGNFIVEKTDLVRQKWVRKNQYGLISKIDMEIPGGSASLGTSMWLFDSRHNGIVLWSKNMPSEYEADRNYYRYDGDRYYGSFYLNYLYEIRDNLNIMSNFLFEHKYFEYKQLPRALYKNEELNRYKGTYNFLSPKIGFNYNYSENLNFYLNTSFAQREPAIDDMWDQWEGPDDFGADPLFSKNDTVRTNGTVSYIEWRNPSIKPESVLDYELGVHYKSMGTSLSANFYYMDFLNEIVPLGQITDEGAPVKGNAESTIHSGFEMTFSTQPVRYMGISGSFSYSKNYFVKYIQYDYGSNRIDLSGNTIATFPDILAYLRLSGNYAGLNSYLAAHHVGKQYLDNTENENRTIDPYTTLNYSLSYRYKNFYLFPEIEVFLKIYNLLNAEYETWGYYDEWAGEAYLYPAATRYYYLGLNLNL